MDINWNILGPEGLAFFGRVTSTATHELSNALGVINENAGLLEDLGLLAEQGHKVDIHKWKQVSKKISNQVKQTYGTIQGLNRFAHSVDHQASPQNIGDLLTFIVFLFSRTLMQNSVTAQVKHPIEPVTLSTSVFLFLNLMGRCLEYSTQYPNEHNKIIVSYNIDHKKRTQISFSGLVGMKFDIFPDRSERELIKVLNGKIIHQADQGKSLVLRFESTVSKKNNN
jgi:hypothetical protein